jgi:hypothetical protein
MKINSCNKILGDAKIALQSNDIIVISQILLVYNELRSKEPILFKYLCKAGSKDIEKQCKEKLSVWRGNISVGMQIDVYNKLTKECNKPEIKERAGSTCIC